MSLEMFLFPNGTQAVCQDGEQVPELQRPWLYVLLDYVKDRGYSPEGTIVNLPNGDKIRVLSNDKGRYSYEYI